MKRLIPSFLIIASVLFYQNVFSQNSKKTNNNSPIPISAEVSKGINDLLAKKYNLKSARVGMTSTKMNIDVFDPYINKIAKEFREKRAHEMAQMAKEYILSQNNGQNMIKSVTEFGITFLKVPAGGLTFPSNVVDEFTYKQESL